MLSQGAVMSVHLFEARGGGHFMGAIMVLLSSPKLVTIKDINRFGETEHSIICSHTFLLIDVLNFVLALMLELAEFFLFLCKEYYHILCRNKTDNIFLFECY